MLRKLIIAIAAAGAAAFCALFIASFVAPGFVEQVGRELIKRQVEKKVHEKIDALDAEYLAQRAGVFAKGFQKEATRAKAELAAGADKKIAAVIAQMANLDCECRKKIERSIHDGYLYTVKNATEAGEKLETLIRTKYMQTAEKLNREFRIFTASNAAVFALLAVVGLAKKKANVHLIPAAVVLLGAAGITGFLYLFNQNWLHTLVFNDYVGFAYIGYLAFALLLLSDLMFNRARVTCRIIDMALQAVGSAAHAVPC